MHEMALYSAHIAHILLYLYPKLNRLLMVFDEILKCRSCWDEMVKLSEVNLHYMK